MAKSLEPRGDARIESSIPIGAVPLESILCTEELHRRPSRPPGHEEENRALVKLVSALADSPSTILQVLAETILHITQCDSAGLSLLTRDGQTPDVRGDRFYWPAIAGMWNPHVGGGTPRNFGPCGDVLDRNRTLLFKHFERRYPYLLPVIPAAEECLLVPFYVAGKAVGTIWAIMHSDRRKFDAEDDRVMGSLGTFASSAYQALASIDELTFQIGEREKAEAALHKLADGLEMQVRVRTQELERSTEELLATNKELEKEITERQRTEQALIGARSRFKDLADEQAALRRVATLVARGALQAEVFAVVAREVAGCLGVPLISIVRFGIDGTATHVGVWGELNPHPVGTSWRLDEHGASGIVYRSGRSARVDYADVPGEIAAKLAREAGIRSAVAVPIVVNSRLWGAMMALSTATAPQAANTEARLASFTELVATALANAESREELQQLADEQAALREVATLVARGAKPQDVFATVAEVTGRLTGAASVNLARFTADEHNLTISGWSKRGTHVPPGTRLPLAGESINTIVWQTRAPGRVDSYEGLSGPLASRLRELGIKSEVGAPVIVDGRLWGALYAGTDRPEPLPPGAEWRLASFAELIGTAVANAEAHRQLEQMADEQAALRQVATLVARGAEPHAIFDAVCEVTGRLIDAAVVNLSRFTSDGSTVTMAGWSQRGNHVPPGTRLPLDGQSVGVLVKRTRAPSRVDNYDSVSGQLAARVRELGIRSGVGAPVIVDGSVWGVLIAGTDQPEPLPAGTELRVASFAELVATAVSNATARSELIESRARMITAFDAARRRVTRDLHDGAQQRFVSAIINLQLAQQKWSSEPEPAKDLLDRALQDASSGVQELREIAAGIHPAILTHRGLSAALDSLAARLPIPVELDVPGLRLPEPVESSIYFFCSEALTNVVKHARASSACLQVALEDNGCTVEVGDDGIGGADSRPGTSGLTGLRDRIGALKGAMEVSSPVAGGTVLRAWIPLPPEPATFPPQPGG